MFEGNYKSFNASLLEAWYGCYLNLNSIPLSDHLSLDEMNQLLFKKLDVFNEIYSRISLRFQGTPNTFNFARLMSSSSISTAGLTSLYPPLFFSMN